MSDENETMIADIDGDELRVRHDPDGVLLEVMCCGCHGVILDLAGIASLRAALDKAEAAWCKREAAKHGAKSAINVVLDAPVGSSVLLVYGGDEPIEALALVDVGGKRVYVCRDYDLARHMARGDNITEVWLSKFVSPSRVALIPQGVKVWREVAS